MALIPKYWYGSIPINTIFRGMNIHLPAIWCSPGVQGFDTLPYDMGFTTLHIYRGYNILQHCKIHLPGFLSMIWHEKSREVEACWSPISAPFPDFFGSVASVAKQVTFQSPFSTPRGFHRTQEQTHSADLLSNLALKSPNVLRFLWEHGGI